VILDVIHLGLPLFASQKGDSSDFTVWYNESSLHLGKSMSTDLPLDSMTTIEKLKILESVWDSLREAPDLPTPEWHRELLAERKQRLKSGKATISTWEDAKKRLNELGNEH
jgi:putative addiction module component (TIGR02574 family)